MRFAWDFEVNKHTFGLGLAFVVALELDNGRCADGLLLQVGPSFIFAGITHGN